MTIVGQIVDHCKDFGSAFVDNGAIFKFKKMCCCRFRATAIAQKYYYLVTFKSTAAGTTFYLVFNVAKVWPRETTPTRPLRMEPVEFVPKLL